MSWRDLFTDSQLATLSSASRYVTSVDTKDKDHLLLIKDVYTGTVCCGAVSQNGYNYCSRPALHALPHISAATNSDTSGRIWRIWE
jgi:hypothetical protein